MTPTEKAILNRTRLLLGDATMSRIGDMRVIIFGVGGVGSWCAESLIRSGVGHLTMVDSDCVNVSNVNRQAMATTRTVGRVKVEAMRERLLDINPDADIEAIQDIYSPETAASYHIEDYDYVVDAIDSLSNKMELILHATQCIRAQKEQLKLDGAGGKPRMHFVSSMGAALKADPTKVRVSEFWDIDGCPLARALRKRMKSQGRYPAAKFQCVWSPEVLPNIGREDIDKEPIAALSHGGAEGRPELREHDWSASKAQINGTLAHITAIFGFMLAGLVLK